MLLADVSEGEIYKAVCQRRKKHHGCRGEWKSPPGSNSEFCYIFVEHECIEGCSFNEAIKVCRDKNASLAEGPDFEFLSNFAKILKFGVNWRLGITYNHSADIFVSQATGNEVDLSNVYQKDEEDYKADGGNDDQAWYPNIDYEYEYPEDLLDVFGYDYGIFEHSSISCMELSLLKGWAIKDGKCEVKRNKELKIQPLCQHD